jgi:hypothetical protein
MSRRLWPEALSTDAAVRISLGIVLLVAAAVRLYALETPQLLHDEALVPCAAEHDWGYIFRRALHSDAHPPYFYWLAKLYMAAGRSEGALRIVSALAGILAVHALFRLGSRVAGTAAGLLAAALLSGHLLHVELSRVLRPHSLIIFLAILSCGFLLDVFEKRDRQSLAKLCLTNLGLLLAHFNASLLVGAEIALAGLFLVLGRLRPAGYGLWTVGLNCALLSVNLWFVAVRLGRFAGVDTGGSMAWTLERTLVNFNDLLTLAPLPLGNLAGWVLCGLGFAGLARKAPSRTAVIAALAFLPPAALILMRYGIIYSPQHIAFLLPFLLLACAHASSRIPIPAAVLAPALALGLAVFLLTGMTGKLYEPGSPMINHNLGQRDLARVLPSMVPPGSAVAFARFDLRDFTKWYLKGFSTLDLDRFALEGSAAAPLTLITPAGPLAPHAEGARLARVMGEPSRTASAGGWDIRQWNVERSPAAPATSLPHDFTLGSGMEEVLRQATGAFNVTPVLSPLGDGLYCTEYDRPGTFSYRLENRSGSPASLARLRFKVNCSEPENVFRVELSFDGAPPVEAFAMRKALGSGEAHVIVAEPGGFTTLDVRCFMTCSSKKPSFNNMPDSISYTGMSARFEPRDEALGSDVALVEENILPPEQDHRGRFRWGAGPESHMLFMPGRAGKHVLILEGQSPMPGQAVEILLDGVPLATVEFPTPGETVRIVTPFEAQSGGRRLTLRYRLFNHGPGGAFAPADGRPMALAFTSLSVRAEAPARSMLVYANPQE